MPSGRTILLFGLVFADALMAGYLANSIALLAATPCWIAAWFLGTAIYHSLKWDAVNKRDRRRHEWAARTWEEI